MTCCIAYYALPIAGWKWNCVYILHSMYCSRQYLSLALPTTASPSSLKATIPLALHWPGCQRGPQILDAWCAHKFVMAVCRLRKHNRACTTFTNWIRTCIYSQLLIACPVATVVCELNICLWYSRTLHCQRKTLIYFEWVDSPKHACVYQFVWSRPYLQN